MTLEIAGREIHDVVMHTRGQGHGLSKRVIFKSLHEFGFIQKGLLASRNAANVLQSTWIGVDSSGC